MRLSLLEPSLAICRLDPAERIPSWALELHHGFVSVTRSEDELSIVCPEEALPGDVETSVEGYRALVIEGPLDLGLTGVLASLAGPLAAAEVPIFVISSYDTDHLLIRATVLDRAITALRDAGHEVDGVGGGAAGADQPIRVASGSPYEARIGFSRAVVAGERVLVSGTGPVVAGGGCPEGTLAQVRRCWEIVLAALAEAGASAGDVVRTRTFLTPAADEEAAMTAHGEVFAEVRPASTMLRVHSLLDPRWTVEVEAEAQAPRAR